MDNIQPNPNQPPSPPSMIPPSPPSMVPPGGGMASEGQKQELLGLIDKTRGKLSEVNAARFSGENMMKEEKRVALKQIFEALQDAGVDLNDPEEVARFLNHIREQDPQKAQELESIIESLMEEEGSEGVEENIPSNNQNMNNENISQNLRGPSQFSNLGG